MSKANTDLEPLNTKTGVMHAANELPKSYFSIPSYVLLDPKPQNSSTLHETANEKQADHDKGDAALRADVRETKLENDSRPRERLLNTECSPSICRF